MLSPRSMSMPPEASAPVLIVSSPRRIGSACARTIDGKPAADAPAAAPAALMNFLRLNVIRRPPPRFWQASLYSRFTPASSQPNAVADPDRAAGPRHERDREGRLLRRQRLEQRLHQGQVALAGLR